MSGSESACWRLDVVGLVFEKCQVCKVSPDGLRGGFPSLSLLVGYDLELALNCTHP